MSLDHLVQQIQSSFAARRATLAVAESCTGGSVSARLTRVPGATQFFLGGVVAYTEQAKVEILKVPRQLIEREGDVSEAVVRKMAENVLWLLGSDYSLSVCGYAGPGGGMPGKPVGTVWCALAVRQGDVVAWKLQLSGSRVEIIERATEELLKKLL